MENQKWTKEAAQRSSLLSRAFADLLVRMTDQEMRVWAIGLLADLSPTDRARVFAAVECAREFYRS